MYDVRLYIEKVGTAKYVSHLDMFRLMQRAVRRADIPLWYTEGFNPHPYISFLQALPLGVESAREPCDIRITQQMPVEEIKERLNGAMPPSFRVADAVIPFNKPSEICYSEYTLVFDGDITEGELNSALASGTLTCEKTGKSGKKKVARTISVSEHISKYDIKKGDDGLTLIITVSAGNTFNLSPSNLLDGIAGFVGHTVAPTRIMRNAFLCEGFAKFE